MDLGPLGSYLLYGAVAVFVIVRQLTPNRLDPRFLLAVPLVLVAFGLSAIGRTPPESALAIGLFGVNLATAVVLGAVRALTIRVWNDRGTGYWQGGLSTLLLWVVAIAVRLGLGAVGAIGQQHGGYQDVLFFLGLTFGVQNLIILARAATLGVQVEFQRGQRQRRQRSVRW